MTPRIPRRLPKRIARADFLAALATVGIDGRGLLSVYADATTVIVTRSTLDAFGRPLRYAKDLDSDGVQSLSTVTKIPFG